MIVALLAAGSLLAPALPVSGQESGHPRETRYFSETGFWVQGEFLEYWDSRGGLRIFGLPITSTFQHEDGLYKQYFERAIFEYHPDHEGTQHAVQLQRLGAIRTSDRVNEAPFRRIDGIASDENCDYYVETGHRLCFGFRTFWREFGGLPNFGFPISEEFDERNQPPPAGDGNGYTVQYFERARFEYHPEFAGTTHEVQLGLLGTEYLQLHGAPDYALERQSPDFPPPDVTSGDPLFRYGFNVAWRGDDAGESFNRQTLEHVNDAGFNAVRIQTHWATLEPEPGNYDFRPIERFLTVADEFGARVLVSVVRSPSWATEDGAGGIPQDTEPFRKLMEELSTTFTGRIDGYEIWNEQNLAHETGGFVDAARYVELIKAGFEGVRAGDPAAKVVFGGLTPTGVVDPSIAIDDAIFLEQVYNYNGGEVRNYYDVLGVHPGSNNNPPDKHWPEDRGPGGWSDHSSFYFRRVEDLREIMTAYGEGHKEIWLTEFGWTTANAAPGYEYGAENSDADQAAYLARAFEIAQEEWPWLTGMYVWNLNFSAVVDESDEKGPWSVLLSDWSPRPAYESLQRMQKIR